MGRDPGNFSKWMPYRYRVRWQRMLDWQSNVRRRKRKAELERRRRGR